ncbi:MAG: carbonic anhydrase [Pseudanabaenaceae cyanobacterium bins.68]|nr:carbonic anhydrase [Pseudanabaenaceae cyanobacterium bins.68]
MRKLLQGLRQFQSSLYPQKQELFARLAHGQNPSVLFITCSDSRIIPSMLTQMDVGDLFVIRNAGNIIPPYGSANGGEGAAIEYAIQALNIKEVVVCGHSNCGAMKGLLKLEHLKTEMPLVYEWLHHAESTRRLVKDNYQQCSGEDLLEITTAENVLTQIDNLQTYPVVRSRLRQGNLQIYGWVYDIESGEILAYEPNSHAFLPANDLAIAEYQQHQGDRAINNTPLPVACPPPAFSTNPNLAPWLSPSQAERIHRGSDGKSSGH